MRPLIRVLSQPPRGLWIHNGAPLTLYASAHCTAEHLPKVTTSAVYAGTHPLFSEVLAQPAQDFTQRVPVECFAAAVPGAAVPATGEVAVTFRVETHCGANSDTVVIGVFPAAQFSFTVANSAQLRDAVIAARGSSYKHVAIRLQPGTYTMPSVADADLRFTDVLISLSPVVFRSLVVIQDGVGALRWAHWRGITFRAQTKRDLIELTDGMVHWYRDCAFQGIGAGTALYLRHGANAKIENCTFSEFGTAVNGPAVIRSSNWHHLSGLAFRDPHVLEGTFGAYLHGTSSAWLSLEKPGSPFVRHNLAVELQGRIFRFTDSVNSMALIGNVLSTKAQDWITLDTIDDFSNNFLAYNSIKTPTDAKFVDWIPALSFGGNYATNNYCTVPLGSRDRWAGSNVWDYNAVEAADTFGANSISQVDPEFADDYLTLRQTSPLLGRNLTLPGISLAFGTLPAGKQIGAMPHVTTALLGGPLVQITSASSVPIATPAPLLSGDSGVTPQGSGGNLLFDNGENSGYLAII